MQGDAGDRGLIPDPLEVEMATPKQQSQSEWSRNPESQLLWANLMPKVLGTMTITQS